VQRESNHEPFNALLTANDRETCRIRSGALRSDHCWEAAWRGIINGDGETDAAIPQIDTQSATTSAHLVLPVEETPRAAAIA